MVVTITCNDAEPTRHRDADSVCRLEQSGAATSASRSEISAWALTEVSPEVEPSSAQSTPNLVSVQQIPYQRYGECARHFWARLGYAI